MKDLARLIITLTIVCTVAALGLGLTYAATREQIIKQEKEVEAKACKLALPTVKKTEDFKERKDLAKKAKKKYKDVVKIFAGYKNGKVVGWCIQIVPRGYGGPVTIAVGINIDGEVEGMKIISQNETPGLGSNIETLKFQKQFEGKKAADKLEVGKDIDAIAGATISSKAFTKGVKEALKASGQLKE